MIVLTAAQTAHLLGRTNFADAALWPRRLNDGQYALPESVLTDPRHARWRSLLQAGTITAVGSLTFQAPVDSAASGYSVLVDSKEMLINIGTPWYSYGVPGPDLFDIPATNLYRFQVFHNNDPNSADYTHNRRRVEFSTSDSAGYADGTTVWAAWSTILTDIRAGFQGNNGGIIHQWHNHHSSTAPYPPYWMGFSGGNLSVSSRSSADGSAHTHYSQPWNPATGTAVNFVEQITFGASGHINVWKDGTKIVDVDTPVGYYSEGLPVIAYPVWGNYMDNIDTTNDVIYHANIEFGTSSLSARVASPTSVSTPPAGWV